MILRPLLAAAIVAGCVVPAAAAGEVPVGSAVAYFGALDALPPEWVPCDGRTVTDSDSPLRGRTLPDLRGHFVRGAATPDDVGAGGGSDRAGLSPAGAHDHGGAAAAGGGEGRTTSVAGLHRHSGQTGPAGGGITTTVPLPGGPGSLVQSGSAHRHSLDTAMGGEHSHSLPAADAHAHAVAAAPAHTHAGDNRPRFTGAWYICRIK